MDCMPMSFPSRDLLQSCVPTTAESIATMVCRTEESATVEMSLVSTDGLQRLGVTCNVKEPQARSAEEH